MLQIQQQWSWPWYSCSHQLPRLKQRRSSSQGSKQVGNHFRTFPTMEVYLNESLASLYRSIDRSHLSLPVENGVQGIRWLPKRKVPRRNPEVLKETPQHLVKLRGKLLQIQMSVLQAPTHAVFLLGDLEECYCCS